MKSVAALLVSGLVVLGCGAASQPDATKEDFAKKPAPANWRGPGTAGPGTSAAPPPANGQ